MINYHKRDMLIQKVAVLLALVLVSYLSAVPVLLHDQGSITKKKNKFGITRTILASSPSPNATSSTENDIPSNQQGETHIKEPWEVNQRQGVYKFNLWNKKISFIILTSSFYQFCVLVFTICDSLNFTMFVINLLVIRLYK